MVTAAKHLFSANELVGSGIGGPALSRLGSELALVYHDVVDQPLPGRLQTLVEQLDREFAVSDRTREDTVTLSRIGRTG